MVLKTTAEIVFYGSAGLCFEASRVRRQATFVMVSIANLAKATFVMVESDVCHRLRIAKATFLVARKRQISWS
jgi:hypothetical protein